MIDIKLTTKAIDVGACYKTVVSTNTGCVDIFVGTVRDNNNNNSVKNLFFEAYNKMAIKELNEIANIIKTKWPVHDILIYHRLGKVKPSQVVVVIAISAAHRNDSINATKYAINELKAKVPIWKKEVYQNGEAWISARP